MTNQNTIDEDDEVCRFRRKKRDDDEMDITPMIDITFLLLIFFVVCSTMDPTKIGKIPEAAERSGDCGEELGGDLHQPGGGDAVVLSRMDGSEFSTDEDAQASEIIEYITSELEKSIGASKQQVMLFGDADVKVGQVTRIQKIIGDAFEDLDSTYIAVKEL